VAGHDAQLVFFLKKEKQRLPYIIDDLKAIAEVRPLFAQEIEQKKLNQMRKLQNFHMKRTLNGTNDLKPNLFLKEI
jgi:hypothetical protein